MLYGKELRWGWKGVSYTQTGIDLCTWHAEPKHCKAADEPRGQLSSLL